jgi:hypothetical protein
MYNYSYANSYGNLGTYGRNSVSVGLGRMRSSPGSITRSFNYCNLASRNLNVAFACTFGLPRNSVSKESLTIDSNTKTDKVNPMSLGGLQYDDCPNLPKDSPYQRCSPWPHFGGTDNTNSRYSTIIGSQRGNIESLFNTEKNHVTISSSSVAADDTFYNCFNIMELINDTLIAIQGYIKAFNIEGKEKWKFSLNDNDTFIRSAPTIGPNNIIYFGTALGYIYALNPDGTLNWKKQYLENIIENNNPIPLSIYGSLVIGKDGNIYFGGSASYTTSNINYGIAVLLSVNKNDGSINFKYRPDFENIEYVPYIRKDVAIDKYDNIYFCYEYTKTPPNKIKSFLISLTNKGKLHLKYPLDDTSTMITYPILNKDNSLVFITSYSFNPSTLNIIYFITAIETLNGKKNDSNSFFLRIETKSKNVEVQEGTLSIDPNDYLYLLIRNEIYKIKKKHIYGHFKANSLNNQVSVSNLIYPSTDPLIGRDGTIYFVATLQNENNYSTYNSYMIAITSDCKLKWVKKFPSSYPNDELENIEVETSPTILRDGSILIQTTNSNTNTNSNSNTNTNSNTNSNYKDKMNSSFYKFN